MIYDLDKFAAIGMGSQGTTPKPDGNHLRWGFAQDLPFPRDGFMVYRREAKKGREICIDFGRETRGRQYRGDFTIDGFEFYSDQVVEIVETMAPASRHEMSLKQVKAMRVHLPQEATEVHLSVNVKDRCALRAYAGSVLVDEAIVRPTGRPQDVVLRGVGLNLVVIDAVATLVLSICYVPPPEVKDPNKPEGEGWRLIAGPLDLPQSYDDGKPRIILDPGEIEKAYDEWMGQAIKVCLDTTDPIDAAERMLRFLEGAGLVPTGTPSGEKATFNVKAQSMLLLAAIDPEIARFLGIGFVDQTAQVGVAYDYLIVGRWTPDGRYCFVLGLVRGPAPALAPPSPVTATPFLTGVAQAGQTGMAVGVNWHLPLAGNGFLLTNAAVSYDVRTVFAAPAAQTLPPSASSLVFPNTTANQDGRIIAGRRRSVAGLTGYPTYLFTHFNRPEGWWAYEGKGYDIFGRESAWSSAAFARVLDQTPPPAPFCLLEPQPGAGVDPDDIASLPLRARYLEPEDPDLTPGDLALIASNNGPVTLIEWNWLPEQQALAPDTKEFRVYRHPRFNLAGVSITSVGVATDTAVSVTLSAAPPFDAVGGELTSRGRNFAITAQSGAVLSVVPNRIGRADGTVELVAPSNGSAQLSEATRASRRWQSRIHVQATHSPPAGYYRVVIPGAVLSPNAVQPIATAWIGVTAVDNKTYIPDDPARTGSLGNRPGNESPIAVRQQIHAVHRSPPPAGPVPAVPQFATRADFFGKSRSRVTFTVMAPATYHVWRSVESTVLANDLKLRKARQGFYQTNSSFADDPGFNAWLATEFPGLATNAMLANPLSATANDAWDAWAARLHAPSMMTDALLQAIASRAFSEAAFLQLTKEALTTGAYDDEFDGRITGRYLFRTQAVFPNGLRGPLSGSSAPVHLHDVVPPRSPVIAGITLANRAATLTWTPVPDADLDHYDVYRALRDETPFIDLRRMTRVGNDLAPAQTSLSDSGLVPGRDYVYVVVAVDTANNRSKPSEPRAAKAIGTAGPPAPALTATRAAAGIDVSWTGAEEGSKAMLERRIAGQADFGRLTAWLEPGIASFHDPTDSTLAIEYRVKLLDLVGNESAYSSVASVPAV